MSKSVPRRLYKYRSLSGSSRDRTIKAISENEIYFANRHQFNDPLDCKLKIHGLSTQDQAKIDSTLDATGIFCLSEVNDNPLMWSHYADSHKGVCIEYSTSGDDLFGHELTPVRYAKSYPTLSTSDNADAVYCRNYLSTKSDHWEHESEWRIFFDQLGVQWLKQPEELSAVILGCKISSEDTGEIFQAVNFRSVQTPVYQASLDDSSFRLSVEHRRP